MVSMWKLDGADMQTYLLLSCLVSSFPSQFLSQARLFLNFETLLMWMIYYRGHLNYSWQLTLTLSITLKKTFTVFVGIGLIFKPLLSLTEKERPFAWYMADFFLPFVFISCKTIAAILDTVLATSTLNCQQLRWLLFKSRAQTGLSLMYFKIT